MAMYDRAWLPNLAAVHNFDWIPAISQRNSAPTGFPKSIDSEMVWTGAKFQGQPCSYRVELNARHIEELEYAAAEVEGKLEDLRVAY
jgi:hypothetical protein